MPIRRGDELVDLGGGDDHLGRSRRAEEGDPGGGAGGVEAGDAGLGEQEPAGQEEARLASAIFSPRRDLAVDAEVAVVGAVGDGGLLIRRFGVRVPGGPSPHSPVALPQEGTRHATT